jgi:tRNA nucleotidyltransferase/poly(A) polymerase
MKIEIPLDEELFQLSEAVQDPIYAVGGVVRDFLFHHFHGLPFDPKDVDIATALPPDEVLGKLRRNRFGIKTLEIGKSFGVVAAVFPSGNKYEIATFRQEWYDPESGDGRHPDKVEFSTPEADAQRRDLTINSLFYNLSTHEVMDFVGTGVEDVINRRVRTVGDPSDRFAEDKLRVLRFVRFLARYNSGFLVDKIHPDDRDATLRAIERFRELEGISPERIRAEFLSAIGQATKVEEYLYACRDLKLLPVMFPGLESNKIHVEYGTRNPHIVLASMFYPVEVDDLCKRLNEAKYSTDEIRHIKFLLELTDISKDDPYKLMRLRDQFDDRTLSDAKRAEAREQLCAEVREYVRVMNIIPADWTGQLLAFRPKTCAADFPHLQGPELGCAIRDGVNQEFWSLVTPDQGV